MSDGYSPSFRLRWLEYLGGVKPHPSAIFDESSRHCRVLQQLWVSCYQGEPDDWRDITLVSKLAPSSAIDAVLAGEKL